MPLTKEKKKQILDSVTGSLKKAKIIIFANFHGLNIKEVTKLRRTLREDGVDYVVVKKTLLKNALKNSGYESNPDLEGEIGIVLGYDDPLIAARDAYNFALSNKETFKLVGGIYEGDAVDKAKINALAVIPSREILLSQLLQVLNGPIGGFERTLNGVQKKFVFALFQIKDSKV